MIHTIERGDDPRLVPYRHVGDPAWLREQDVFVAEGRLVVARLIESGHAIESVMLTPAAHDALGTALPEHCPAYVVPQSIVASVTGFHFHRGCLAIAPRLRDRGVDAFGDAERLVILESVGNPDNVGGIFRSAAALGAGGVLIGPGTGDPLYRKAMRTSMGAALRVPFAAVAPWPDALERVRARGFRIAALSPIGALTIEQFASTVTAGVRVALMAGAEGPGLSGAALSAADVTVRIPVDARSDSLNVVVAVSIALQELRR